MLAKNVTQVFYVPDTRNKILNVVIPGKRRIVEVENVVNEEAFGQFDEIPPFAPSMIKLKDREGDQRGGGGGNGNQ
jgi:hypothetical protein